MSRHQAYRNYDYEADFHDEEGDGQEDYGEEYGYDGYSQEHYDNEDYDQEDYEEEDGQDELSAEDKELMRDATANVRTVLGDDASKVTEAQIQEALWHYYYDVEKSVAYLTRTFISPPPKKKPAAKPKPQPTPAATPKKTVVKKKSASSVASIASDVEKLNINTAPLAKSKNLDVLSEYSRVSKKNANFVVVGHVDAGKSTMMARMLLDMKVVDQRTIEKYEKEAASIGKSSFALAWVLDSSEDERNHGVTIDVATRHFETETTSFTILDAPGHQDFVPNMIAGASQADYAVLVLDAKTGAFESGLRGQTREHAIILRSMGVLRVIVAINKLDTVDWSEERYNEIVAETRKFLSETQFKLSNVSFVPVSGLHGDNIVNRSTNPAAAWYKGGTILEELENSKPIPRELRKPLRLTVSEVYKLSGGVSSPAGRIDAGSLQVGDALLVSPGNVTAHIKSILCNDEPADWAVAGQNVVLNLANVNPLHVYPGVVLSDPAKPTGSMDSFTMKALAFEPLVPMNMEMHRGRLVEFGAIEELMQVLDKFTGEVIDKHPVIVRRGKIARIRVKLTNKLPMDPGQRIILRSGGSTIAAGVVE